MVRLAFRRAVVVLAAALATACLGGQTGQPTSGSGSCDPTSLAPTAAWGGTTVLAAAQAFEGTYRAGLQWRVEARSSTTQTPVDLVDSVQLTINYEDAKVGRSCVDHLNAPVSVALTTSDSGLAESGPGMLTIALGQQGLVGSLHFESARVRLDAMLDEAALETAPRGNFDALDQALPGASASFIEQP
jgi:hypothetical protein